MWYNCITEKISVRVWSYSLYITLTRCRINHCRYSSETNAVHCLKKVWTVLGWSTIPPMSTKRTNYHLSPQTIKHKKKTNNIWQRKSMSLRWIGINLWRDETHPPIKCICLLDLGLNKFQHSFEMVFHMYFFKARSLLWGKKHKQLNISLCYDTLKVSNCSMHVHVYNLNNIVLFYW